MKPGKTAEEKALAALEDASEALRKAVAARRAGGSGFKEHSMLMVAEERARDRYDAAWNKVAAIQERRKLAAWLTAERQAKKARKAG